jgi:uncharacterized protein
MRALSSLICGFIFGWGLFLSGMLLPTKVLGFLDFLAVPSGNWDPSLAVVMAAGLAVTGVGYAWLRPRTPAFESQIRWPTQTAIDTPLVAGSVLFGIGWGLVGLCPGPAIENLATLSPGVIIFVVAMAIGMAAHNFWQRRSSAPAPRALAHASAADG